MLFSRFQIIIKFYVIMEMLPLSLKIHVNSPVECLCVSAVCEAG